jgi:hypothetical protein
VQQERRDHQRRVTDLVRDQAADDDAEAEAGEPRTVDLAVLRGAETVLSRPVGQHAAADREADAGGQDREEPGEQQALCVGRDRLV